jgi:3-hydroxybutyryl-CoA dehydratase
MSETHLNEPQGIVIGKALPTLTKRVTQKMINRWAEVSGDFNPLHVDPDFGKTTFFGTNIAHGPLILSFIIEMLTRWLGKGWISGGRLYDVRLVAPVPPDTEIIAGGEVIAIEHEGSQRRVDCEIFVKNQNDKLIVTGKASAQFRRR